MLGQQSRIPRPELGHLGGEFGEDVLLLDGVVDAELGAELEAELDEAAGGEEVEIFVFPSCAGAVELVPGEAEVVVLVDN